MGFWREQVGMQWKLEIGDASRKMVFQVNLFEAFCIIWLLILTFLLIDVLNLLGIWSDLFGGTTGSKENEWTDGEILSGLVNACRQLIQHPFPQLYVLNIYIFFFLLIWQQRDNFFHCGHDTGRSVCVVGVHPRPDQHFSYSYPSSLTLRLVPHPVLCLSGLARLRVLHSLIWLQFKVMPLTESISLGGNR